MCVRTKTCSASLLQLLWMPSILPLAKAEHIFVNPKTPPKSMCLLARHFFLFSKLHLKTCFSVKCISYNCLPLKQVLDVISFPASILRVLFISDFSCICHPFISEQCVCFSIFWLLKSWHFHIYIFNSIFFAFRFYKFVFGVANARPLTRQHSTPMDSGVICHHKIPRQIQPSLRWWSWLTFICLGIPVIVVPTNGLSHGFTGKVAPAVQGS